MGAISFSIDPHLVRFLVGEAEFDVFVETGTYQGVSVERARPYFPEIISIEYAETYYQEASARFADDDAITIVQGDSAEVLAGLQERLTQEAVLFWLDAHWCVDEKTAGAASQCPLLRELAAIGSLNPQSVVLIDDARLFLAPPGVPHDYAQWPTWAEIWQALRRLSDEHDLMVVSDVLVFHPRALADALRAFAHTHGVDWLRVADKSRQYDRLLEEVEEKEQVIQEIHAAAEERLARLRQFEKDLAVQDQLVRAKDRALAAMEAERAAHEEILRSKDQEHAARGKELAARREEVAARAEALQARDAELAAREAALEAREAELAASQNDLLAREEAAAALEADLRALEDELASRQATLADREAELADRASALETREAAAEGRQDVLQAREAELAAKEAELAAKDARLAALDDLIQAHEAKLAARDDALAATANELAATAAALEAKEGELAARDGELAAQTRELALQGEVLAYKEQELIAKEAVIQDQQVQLVAKEEVIQRLDLFRQTSFRYWLGYRLGPFVMRLLRVPLRPVHGVRRSLRAALQPRLGNLNQHPPIPLALPPRYQSVQVAAETPPTISIVTPSYNHAAFLERTIESVLGQDYPNLEYILQDGGSTDDTGEILARYRAQCAHVESREDRGQAHAINLGFAHATGEIMAWLNSDDLLLPGTLAYVADFFTRNPDVDVVYGHRILIDEQDQEIGRWILPAHDPEILNWADYVPQETLFWRRRIWEAAGGEVDESFRFALDWDLLLRFQEAGARFVRLPRFMGAFRVYAAQKTLDWADVGQEEMARLRERANGRTVTWEEINEHIHLYLRRSAYLHLLYRAGLLRP